MEKQLVENVAPHSVQLTTNAKGKIQAEVKVYAENPQSAATQALTTLKFIREQLAGQMAE